MKVLSVVVPSYNVEKYLKKNLDAFVSASVLDLLEIIVVNDGSSDGTLAIANEYAEKYPESVIVIDKENGGHGSAVNAGIVNATGRYFRIVDADDWVDTDVLCEMVRTLKASEVDLYITNFRTVHMETGEKIDYLFENINYGQTYSVSEIIQKNIIFPMTTVCYKTEILKNNNIRLSEKTFYVDEQYNVMPFAFVKTILFEKGILYNYLIGNVNQSINMKNQIARIDQKIRVAKSVIDFLKSTSMPRDNYTYCCNKAKGIITSIYLIMLVYNTDKVQGRQIAEQFNRYVRQNSPDLYSMTNRKYRIFKVLSGIPKSAEIYDKIRKSKGI